MVVLQILSCLCLAAITWYDFKSQLIPLYLLVLELAFVYTSFYLFDRYYFAVFTAINWVVFALMMALMVTWFKIKNSQHSFFKDLFGWGDVLMIAIAAPFFPPILFVLFILVSSIVGLVYYQLTKTKENRLIPLAGIMAIVLIMIHMAQFFGVDTYAWDLSIFYKFVGQ